MQVELAPVTLPEVGDVLCAALGLGLYLVFVSFTAREKNTKDRILKNEVTESLENSLWLSSCHREP